MNRAAVLLLALLPATARAEERPDRPLITVTGEAEVRVVPDEAVLRLRVVTVDKDLVLAKSRNDASVKDTLAAARGIGVSAEQLQTSAVAIDRNETAREGQVPLFLGYEVTKTITVILKDLSRVDDLLTALVKAGTNRIDAFELRSTEVRKHKDEARARAIKAAREKAVALTREIGQTIGKAFTITEEPEFGGARNYSANNVVYDTYTQPTGGTFATGQNAITARVVVSFELQ
jgi:uncharacterized protein YggE